MKDSAPIAKRDTSCYDFNSGYKKTNNQVLDR